MFHNGLSVPRGSCDLRASVFRATCFFVFVMVVVLSPKFSVSLSGIILIGDVCLRFTAFFFTFCSVELSEAESLSGVSSLNLITSFGFRVGLDVPDGFSVQHWLFEASPFV